MAAVMPCTVPDTAAYRRETEHAIMVERELRIAAEARADAAEHTAGLHAAELAVLRPRLSELEARVAALHRHPPA